jgi:actin related protein 2/3 complex subunit 5
MANAAVVDKVLSVISEGEISSLIQALDPEACDVLMKYVYRSMANASNCSLMLKLHNQLSEKAGLGCIVRAMAERKTV